MPRPNFCKIFFSLQIQPLHSTPWHNRVTRRGGGMCRLNLFRSKQALTQKTLISNLKSSEGKTLPVLQKSSRYKTQVKGDKRRSFLY